MGNKYLDELGKTEKVTVLQFQKLLHPGVYVYIKPSNHKTYWSGEAVYIPKDLYDLKVTDIILRKKWDDEENLHGSMGLFVETNDKYEILADTQELEDINNYYASLTLKK